MNAEDLKITVVRAVRPGDVVFFQVSDKVSQAVQAEAREIVVAAAKYLREHGIIPVMLPESITVGGAVLRPFIPESSPTILTMAEVNALIEWHKGIASSATRCDDLDAAHEHHKRIEELRNMEVSDGPSSSGQTVGSPGPAC